MIDDLTKEWKGGFRFGFICGCGAVLFAGLMFKVMGG